jgi:predicted Zn-dependent protease
VRPQLDIDDVEELEFRARTADQHRAAADVLLAWAAERHPDDDEEVTPALLLVKAGEQLGFAGDPGAAVEAFRSAQTADGEVLPDVRCYLHHGLIEVGDVDGARRLADEVRRSKPTDPDVYVFLAEDYELVEDLVEANRWLNLGLRRLMAEDDELSDSQAIVLLSARRRVRQALGFPPDEFDEESLLPSDMDLPE